MPGPLASYRFRRRLLKLAALIAIAGAAGLVSVLYWNTGHSYETPLSTEPALLPEQQRNVRLSKAERSQALATAALFVKTAVVREHVDRSYALAHPKLRQGLSREQWGTGEIPVQYYPVDAARWRLEFQYADELGLEVYVVPRGGADLRPMVFDMSMRPVDATAGRRWLVSSWTPRFSAAGQTRPSSSERFAVPAPVPERKASSRRSGCSCRPFSSWASCSCRPSSTSGTAGAGAGPSVSTRSLSRSGLTQSAAVLR